MNDRTAPLERVPTGIPGLDPVLQGGLLKGGVYIVQGPPGAGKTILGNQICFNHARTGGNAVYVTLLAESHTRMLAHMRGMSFFQPRVIPERVYYVSCFKVLEGEGLEGLLKVLRTVTASRHATFLVLDGLVSAEEASPSAKDFKKFIHELQSITAMTDCTALLLGSTERPRGFRPEHTMVDGIIELSDDLAKLRSIRHLQVRKMRGANPVRGKHTLEITSDGITIHPRIETQLQPAPGGSMTPDGKRMKFGIEGLDAMLGGGLPGNSTTMLLGPSGCGKTTLGLQFLASGARVGEPGLCFSFYERPRQLLRKSERIGLDVGQWQAKGLIDFVWQPPVEGVIDVLAQRLLQTVEHLQARRLFLDGIQGFEVAAEFPERIRDAFSALVEELERRGVTTVYTVETRDLFGPNIVVPLFGISATTQNIMLLRHVELHAQLFRMISILKLRDSNYDSTIREFRITDRGIDVADTFNAANHVLTGTAVPNGHTDHAPTATARSKRRSKARPIKGKRKKK
jgi:circadian clock protein KaiC